MPMAHFTKLDDCRISIDSLFFVAVDELPELLPDGICRDHIPKRTVIHYGVRQEGMEGQLFTAIVRDSYDDVIAAFK